LSGRIYRLSSFIGHGLQIDLTSLPTSAVRTAKVFHTESVSKAPEGDPVKD
jgi:hypothetical protein